MTTFIVAETPRQGARTGPLAMLGHSALELVLLVLLVVGLGELLARPSVHGLIAIVGGLMLIVTGAIMLSDVKRHRSQLMPKAHAHLFEGSWAVIGGVVASLANPCRTIWWATIGIGVLTRAYAFGLVGVAAFHVGHILGDFVWYTALSTALAVGRRWITLHVCRGIIVVAACFLFVLAAWFLVSGIGWLPGTPAS